MPLPAYVSATGIAHFSGPNVQEQAVTITAETRRKARRILQRDGRTIAAVPAVDRARRAVFHATRQDRNPAMSPGNAVVVDLTFSDNETPQRTQHRHGNGAARSHASKSNLTRPKNATLSRARPRQSESSMSGDQRHVSRAKSPTSDTARNAGRTTSNVERDSSVTKAETILSSLKGPRATKSKANCEDGGANAKSSPSKTSTARNSGKNDMQSRTVPVSGCITSRGLRKTEFAIHERDLPEQSQDRSSPARTRSKLQNGMATLSGTKRHRDEIAVEESAAAKKRKFETRSQNSASGISSVNALNTSGNRSRLAAVSVEIKEDATVQQETENVTGSTPGKPPLLNATTRPANGTRRAHNNGQSDVVVDLTQVATPKQRKAVRQPEVVDLSSDEESEHIDSSNQAARSNSRTASTPNKRSHSVIPSKPADAAARSLPSRASTIAHKESPHDETASASRSEPRAGHATSKSGDAPSNEPSREPHEIPHDSPMALDVSDEGSESGNSASKQTSSEQNGPETSDRPITTRRAEHAAQIENSINVPGYDSTKLQMVGRAALPAVADESAPGTPDKQRSAAGAVVARRGSIQALSTSPLSAKPTNGVLLTTAKQATTYEQQPTSANDDSRRIKGSIKEDHASESTLAAPTNAIGHAEQRTSSARSRQQRPSSFSFASPSTAKASAQNGRNALSSRNPFGQFFQGPTETLSKTVERILGAELSNYATDNEYYHRVELKHARLSKRVIRLDYNLANNHRGTDVQFDQPYSFRTWKPLSLEPKPKSASSGNLFDTERAGKPGRTRVAVSYVALKPQDKMPAYAHYVSIKENFLALNSRNLHYTPYFEEGIDDAIRDKSLGTQYDLDIQPRRRKLMRLQHAETLEAYAEQTLEILGLKWSDVLSFLFDPHPNVGEGDADALRALADRDLICNEDFKRCDERAQTVLSCLPKPEPQKIARAAILCERFSKMAHISLWHIARKHLFDALSQESGTGQTRFLDAFTCRVCMRFDCPYHGQIDEYEDDYDELDEQSPEERKYDPVITDIIHPRKVNYRTRTAFNPAPAPEQAGDMVAGAVSSRKRDLSYWQKFVYQNEERDVFHPCHHPGLACDQAECSCFNHNLPCEKTCSCSVECARKFQGCNCKKGGRKICFEDDRCLCSQLGRECDPDLCGSCGVIDVVDPLNRYNDEVCKGKCKNAGIQRGVPKCTVIGESVIHGFGLFLNEDVGPDEFIGEYKGEIIMKEEAERRGCVYEFQKLSYLFSLNKTQEVDSTYFGNKIRFINHAEHGHDNAYPRIRFVNATHHIALYTKQKLKAGEELFFNYGPHFTQSLLGRSIEDQKGNKSRPIVHNPNVLLEDMYKVDHEVDERGNRRATKGPKIGRPRKDDVAATKRSNSARSKTQAATGDHEDETDAGAEIGVERHEEEMRDAEDADAEVREPQGAGARLNAYYIDGSDDFDPAGIPDSGEDADDDDYSVDKSDEEGDGSSDKDERSSSCRPRRSRRSYR